MSPEQDVTVLSSTEESVKNIKNVAEPEKPSKYFGVSNRNNYE